MKVITIIGLVAYIEVSGVAECGGVVVKQKKMHRVACLGSM